MKNEQPTKETAGVKAHAWGWITRFPILSVCIALALIYGIYEVASMVMVYCRDAYVTTDVIYIAPEVSGPVSQVLVGDDERVEKGQVLFIIDATPFQLALNSQKAALDLASANLKKAQDQIALATSEINGQEATFENARANRDRVVKLSQDGVVSAQALSDAQKSYEVALAGLTKSRGQKTVAMQEVDVQNSLIAQAQAGMAQAEYEISRTKVCAPVSGRLAPIRVRTGQYVQTGAAVMALVSRENWHIVANLQERYLEGIAVGQRVTFSIGSSPWHLHTGRIRSIAPGVARSDKAIGVLPYVDPSTDWIRLPRRFPVEIDIDPLQDRETLYQGANATVWMIKPWSK